MLAAHMMTCSGGNGVERCTCLEGSSRLGLIGDSLEGYIAAVGFIDNSLSLLPTIDLVFIIFKGLVKIV